ncbi:anti-sigma factor family protein [Actinosynnema sp. CA-248983]
MTGCREAVRELWQFLDGELPPDERHGVEEHLERCVRCCGELEFAQALRGLLGAQRAEPMPADVRARLERFIDDLE